MGTVMNIKAVAEETMSGERESGVYHVDGCLQPVVCVA